MLFVGDDWAEDHHDVEVQDESGRKLARARLPEGLAGIERLHALIAGHCSDELGDADPREAARSVVVGIETDRGPWVQALVAAGYQVYPINPMSVARYRERHSPRGRRATAVTPTFWPTWFALDRDQHRPLAGDSDLAEAIKIVARAHQSLIWDRQRHVLRLRSALREFFPAALQAFDDLAAAEAVELLGRAPSPTAAARLSRSKIAAACTRARRRDVDARAAQDQELLRAPALRQPAGRRGRLRRDCHRAGPPHRRAVHPDRRCGRAGRRPFWQHPDAEIYLSQPGIGPVLGARVLAEFGDDAHRYTDAKARKNYAGTSPITKASGKKHSRPRPLRPQHSPRRRPAPTGLLRATCIAGGPRLLRQATGPRARATTPLCASSPTGSSASSTAASKPVPATTKPLPGQKIYRPPLDTTASWDV